MHPFINVAIDGARKAGSVIMRALNEPAKIKVASKGPLDFVTNVDKKAEEAIMYAISRAYPSHSFMGEESGEILNANKDHLWIIDPLDGTTNFIHGYPHFAVSIALQVKGRIEHGVIYDPVRQDIFCASRGQGAQLNNRRLRVSSATSLNKTLVAFNLTRPKECLAQHLDLLSSLTGKVAGIRNSGSAALDLGYLASGALDAFWHTGLQSWDIAAGALIANEAGAVVTDITGGTDYLTKGNIIAANPKLVKQILQLQRKGLSA